MGSIILWDLGTKIVDGRNGVVDPTSMFVGCGGDNDDMSCTEKDATVDSENRAVLDGMEKLSLSSKVNYKVIFGIPHHLKPNWIVNSTASDPSLPSSLFVADTSNNISVYM